MHAEALEWCRKWGSDQRGKALDVGGRDVNGTARQFWPNMEWTVLDLHGDPNNHLDRVIEGDARYWEPDQPYDLVISTELLEHVNPWWLCVATMVEAMNANGFLLITCAGTGRRPHGMHGDPDPAPDEHYANVNPFTLWMHLYKIWGLQGITINVHGSDVRAVASRMILT